MRALIVAVSALLAVLGTFAAFGKGDITPPVFVGALPSHPHISTEGSATTITFSVHVTDDLTGATYVYLNWVNEHGYNTSRGCDWWGRDNPKTDAYVVCAVTFPRYSAEGRWMINYVTVEDAVGNRLEVRVSNSIYIDGKIVGYVYSEDATAAMRALEIHIGAEQDPLPAVYLPYLSDEPFP